MNVLNKIIENKYNILNKVFLYVYIYFYKSLLTYK
jgi:hypothetical protein